MLRSDVPENLAHAESGLYRAVPDALYHARVPGIASKSALDQIARTPAHYAAWLAGAEHEESPALAFGKAFHCALLEPDVFRRTYTIEPKFGDCRKTENKKRRDNWRMENAGRCLLEANDAHAISEMVKSVMAHPLAGPMFKLEGECELTMRWVDEDTGLVCKGRADRYLTQLDTCVDIKTCDDARADVFNRSVANYGYERQGVFYEDGFENLGAPLERFVFVAVEKRAPYLVALFELDDEYREMGREWTRRNLRKLAKCIERGTYEGHPSGIQKLSPPTWARNRAA